MSLLPFVGGFLCFRSSPRKRTWMRSPQLQKASAAAAAVRETERRSRWRETHPRPCCDSSRALSAKTHHQSSHQRSLQVQSPTSLMKTSTKPWKSWTNLPTSKTPRPVCIMTMLMFSITPNPTSTEMTGCCKLWWTFWGRKTNEVCDPELEIFMLLLPYP